MSLSRSERSLIFGQRGPLLSPPDGDGGGGCGIGEAGAAGGERGELSFPTGPIRTRAPWNGRPIGADWALVARWGGVIAEAARREGVDPRWIAAVMAVETQGIHERDGQVLEVWDDSPQDGPSVGVMQVKPRVWGWLRPDVDPYTAEGNIRLGAAVLRHLVDKYGSFANAIALGYHPAPSRNGTTPLLYELAARGLLEELDHAA
jgi:hypothetical protein